MVLNFNPENFLDGCFDTLNTRITKLDYLTGVGNDNMIMLLRSVRFFKLCQIFTELMLSNKVAGQ